MIRRCLGAAAIGVPVLMVWCLTASQARATSYAPAGVSVTVLAEGPVKALPAGKIFDSVLEFRQNPGADFGPHAHVAAIVYTLHGTSTISVSGGPQQSIGEGQAVFIPQLTVHTHQNLEGRIGAGAIAVGLIAVVILLCVATLLHGRRRRIIVASLSVLLILVGTLPLVGATSNDYYLLAIRAPTERNRPMPRPDGQVVFLSPDLNPVPPGPYVETLSAITVPAGATYDAAVAQGPQMVVVLEGSAAVHIGDQTTQLSSVGGTAFAQMGQTVAIGNQGSGTLKVLQFVVAGGTAG